MKRIVFIAAAMLASMSVNAQLKVDENGQVGIGSISDGYKVAIVSLDNGMKLVRSGTPPSGQNTEGIYSYSLPTKEYYNFAVKGVTRITNPLNTGRAFGIYGQAGGTTSGYNYGIFGTLYGSQNGAGVYGTTQSDNGVDVGGRYAGYFNGDVKVTGTLYAPVFTTTSASSSISTAQATLSAESTEGASVSDKLAQLSAVQYSMNLPVGMSVASTAATASTTYTSTAVSDTLSGTFNPDTTEVAYPSDIEIQALEKSHYGLVATELQAIYPDLVYENQQGDLCINYIEMIPLLVESIKELKAEITALQGGGDEGVVVMSRSTGGVTDIGEATALSIPVLKQNNPNPFTESTVIACTLPETVQTANIYIYDMNGTQIEQIPLTERGETSVTVSGGQLSAGMYLYSLIADGKVIDTKRMILTK